MTRLVRAQISSSGFFLYTIQISNEGPKPYSSLADWIITDANGKVEEVQGPGVVGEQPVLATGQSFEYTSGCPLTTPFGTMRYLQMTTTSGVRFDAQIAAFTLSEPHALHKASLCSWALFTHSSVRY
jgi:ApaG protein